MTLLLPTCLHAPAAAGQAPGSRASSLPDLVHASMHPLEVAAFSQVLCDMTLDDIRSGALVPLSLAFDIIGTSESAADDEVTAWQSKFKSQPDRATLDPQSLKAALPPDYYQHLLDSVTVRSRGLRITVAVTADGASIELVLSASYKGDAVVVQMPRMEGVTWADDQASWLNVGLDPGRPVRIHLKRYPEEAAKAIPAARVQVASSLGTATVYLPRVPGPRLSHNSPTDKWVAVDASGRPFVYVARVQASSQRHERANVSDSGAIELPAFLGDVRITRVEYRHMTGGEHSHFSIAPSNRGSRREHGAVYDLLSPRSIRWYRDRGSYPHRELYMIYYERRVVTCERGCAGNSHACVGK